MKKETRQRIYSHLKKNELIALVMELEDEIQALEEKEKGHPEKCDGK